MRMKPLPMATVATQTDACSEDGSYWDLLSLVTNDNDDDVDSVVGLSDVDELEQCRAASSQTQLATFNDSCSNWALSCARLSDDDDGYDVIVDDSDDSGDFFDDTFAKREARRRIQQNSELSSYRRADSKAADLTDTPHKLMPMLGLRTSRDWQVPRAETSNRTETNDMCHSCKRNVGQSTCLPVLHIMRAVPRMGTRLAPRPSRTVSATTCKCGRGNTDMVDRERGSSQGERRGGEVFLSVSDSEKSSATLTDVQFRRAWSSDGDAAAAAVDSSSSSEGNSSSELSPGAGPRDGKPITCPRAAVTATTDPEPGSKPGGSSAVARRLAYEQCARVMYTNRANLQHTIAVQQRLFQQQLAHPAFQGYINTSQVPPPLPPRRGMKVNEDGWDRGDKSDDQLEWVVRRRADGTRYITRRPATSRHRLKRSRDVTSGRDSQPTSSSGDHKNAAGKAPTGKTEHGRRKEEKETDLVTKDAAPERTKEQSKHVHSKSATAFHSAPITSLRQAHPLLAVITI